MLVVLLLAAPVRGQDATSGELAGHVTLAEYLPAIDRGASRLNAPVTVHLDNVSRIVALRHIAKQAGLQLTYGDATLSDASRVDVHVDNGTAFEAVYQVIEGTDLRMQVSPSGHLVLSRRVSFAVAEPLPASIQTGVVTGVVTDSLSGEALPGVNVVIAGTTQGTSTNMDGEYVLPGVEEGTHTLQASFVGYKPKAITSVEVEANDTTVVNFMLAQSTLMLEGIVAIGYGEQQRSEVTGSITSVSAEELTAAPTADVAEALQGQAPVVLVTQTSGEPGAGMDVLIRGAATLGNSDPLYVIDGIPLSNDGTGSVNPLATLNPSDIESIDILKDASAAAIYGSRAANGVVLITTTRGVEGLQVQFNARGGLSSVPQNRRLDMMTTQQFYEFSVDAYENAGLPIPAAWQEPNLSQNLAQNTDWQDALFEQGAVQDYNLTVSGGSEDAIYSISGGYTDQKGTVVGDGFNRLSMRVNSEFYIGANDQFTIGENIMLSQSTWRADIGADTFKETFQQSPTVPLRCPENEGGFCGPTLETSPGFRLNQVALLHLEEDEDVTQRLVGKVYGKYNFLPNLSYRLDVSADIAQNEGLLYTPLYDLQSNVNAERDLEQSISDSRAIILENTLNYFETLADVHEIDLLAGYAQERRTFDAVFATAQGFPSGNLRTINAATGLKTVQGGGTESSLQSVFGRIQYSYDERYRLHFNIRRDGSSRFGSESRWGTFPAASVGWSVHNESFMSGYESISQLLLRGSWGVTGSQQIPDFAWIPTVVPVANYVFGNGQQLAPGASVLTLGNSKLQWQETKQLDVGLDLGLLDDRITLVLDYFRKNTSNLLLRVPIATSSGIWRNQGPYQNVGEVRNSGFELGAIYNQSIGDVTLRLNGNVSTVSNEVVDIGSVDEIIMTVSDELGEAQTITRPGSEVGAFYGYIADGIFRTQDEVDSHADQSGAAPGDLRFRDLNGDGVVNAADRTIIGSPFPNFFYGFIANLGFRNWDLRLQIDGVQGRDIFALRADNDPKGFNNATTDYLDRWTPDNPDGTHPRATVTDPNANLRSSTYRIEDGSYLALRNITLGYDFGSNMLNWSGARSLRVFVGASNLLWLTSYDGYNPEIGAGDGIDASLTRSLDTGSYPIARTFEVGLQLGL